MANTNNNLSIGVVIALIESISKDNAIKYSTLGIKSIVATPNGDGMIITLIDDSVSTIYFTSMMMKSIYDTINDGSIGVDNARNLGGNLPIHYTTSKNQSYDKTKMSNLVSDNVQDAIDEESVLIFRTDDKVVKLENEIVSDYVNNEYVERSLKDVVLNHSKLITNEKAEKDLQILNDTLSSVIDGILDNIVTLRAETENNNQTSKNIIKGDYLKTDNSNIITLDKSESGVIINGSGISNRLIENETNILLNQEYVDELNDNVKEIIRGDYTNIAVGNGLSITKTQASGVVIGTNTATKIQKGVVSIGEGIEVDSNGVISAVGNGIPFSEKGSPNGVCPLNEFTKIDTKYLPNIPTKLDLYSLSELSDIPIAPPSAITHYRQISTTKEDIRYNKVLEASISYTVTSAINVPYCFSSGITDRNIIDGTYEGATIYTSFYTKTSSANSPLTLTTSVFLKNGITGVETLLGNSTSVLVNSPQLRYYITNTNLSTFTSVKANGDRLCIKHYVSRTTGNSTTLTYNLEGQTPCYSTLYYTTVNSTIDIDDVVGLAQVFDGTSKIIDVSLIGHPYKLSQNMGLVNYSNETIYVRGGDTPTGIIRDGKELTPYNNIPTALGSSSSVKSCLQVLDGSTYNGAINIPVSTVKFIAPYATIVGDIVINTTEAYIVLGNIIGNITINQPCTLIVNGELKGNIVSNSISPTYIRVNRINDVVYPLTIEDSKVMNGSIIGRYQYGMVAK